MVDVVGFEPTAFRLRAEYSDPVELHIHKKLYLILSTNYNHLTTLYPPVNNLLKKWPGRLVTLQHLVLFRDTLIYFSYYRIKNLMYGWNRTNGYLYNHYHMSNGNFYNLT